MSKKLTLIIIAISLIITVLSLYILFTNDLSNNKPLAGQGGNNDNTLIGGSFVLIDQNGQAFHSSQMQNHLSLVYFGFTFCPDVCPTTLQKLTDVLLILDKYQINDILPIFITLDPDRDTPELLQSYLKHFHQKLIGLTGSQEQINHVANLYKVFYSKTTPSGNQKNNYLLDHSSFIYLMDHKGKYIKHFYATSTAQEIVDDIRYYARY